MKSANKVLYNHRIAQSKESWETDFLSKIEDGNDLLYLAATKLYGAGKESYKDFYIPQNKSALIAKIKEIATSPYNQRWHKNFEQNIDAAISQLDKEIAKNKTTKPEKEIDTNPSFGSGSRTTIPGMATPSVAPEITTGTFDESPDDTEEDKQSSSAAKLIVADIKNLMKSADSDQNNFVRNFYKLKEPIDKKIAEQKDSFLTKNPNDMISINRWLEKLNDLYIKIHSPTGAHKAGKTYFVTDYNTAFDDLRNTLLYPEYYEADEAKAIIKIIQKNFLNKYPNNTDIAGQNGERIKEFNTLINKYNDKWETNLPKLVYMIRNA